MAGHPSLPVGCPQRPASGYIRYRLNKLLSDTPPLQAKHQLNLGVGHHGLDDDNSAASGNGRVPAAGEGGHHRIIGDDVVAGDQIEKRLRGDVVQIALAIVVRTSQGNAYLDWPWT